MQLTDSLTLENIFFIYIYFYMTSSLNKSYIGRLENLSEPQMAATVWADRQW